MRLNTNANIQIPDCAVHKVQIVNKHKNQSTQHEDQIFKF